MTILRPVLTVLLLAALLPIASASASADRLQRVEDAVKVLDEVMMAPDRAIPKKLLEDAHAIAIIPNVVKASFVLGGRHGKGVIVVRAPDGSWSHPSFISLTGGSVGFQAGIKATDVVLVFRTSRGVDSIVHGKFTLGGDASVAAGPVGRTAEAGTDGQFKAEIYAYSRARGLFAGVALDGAVLAIDHKSNQAVYGRNTTPRMAFENRVGPTPDAIVVLRDKLEEYTAP